MSRCLTTAPRSPRSAQLLRTTALLNWQMNDLKEQIRQGNVIAGQQLALAARQYYGQRLGELSQAMSQGSVR